MLSSAQILIFLISLRETYQLLAKINTSEIQFIFINVNTRNISAIKVVN